MNKTSRKKTAYVIVHLHPRMLYPYLSENNFPGDTNALLLRCFLFISKLEALDIITTGRYITCRTYSNLQFRPPLRNCFHCIHIDIERIFPWKNILLFCGYHSTCFKVWKSLQRSFLTGKKRYKMVLSNKLRIHFLEVLVARLERESERLQKLMGQPLFYNCVILSLLQKFSLLV